MVWYEEKKKKKKTVSNIEHQINNIKKLHPRNNGGRHFFRPTEDMCKRNK